MDADRPSAAAGSLVSEQQYCERGGCAGREETESALAKVYFPEFPTFSPSFSVVSPETSASTRPLNRRLRAFPQFPPKQRTSMDSLPDELITSILSFVSSSASSPSDVVSAWSTCKRWNKLGMNTEVLKRVSRGGVAVRAKSWGPAALAFLRAAADAGSLEACFMLGMILFYCVPGCHSEGTKLLVKCSKEGHAAALHAMALINFNGSGFSRQAKDLKVGVALCARAAALGHVDAMRELGHCLLDGFGVKQEYAEGWRMLLRAHLRELKSPASRSSSSSSSPSCSCPDVYGNVEAKPVDFQQRKLRQLFLRKDKDDSWSTDQHICIHGSQGRTLNPGPGDAGLSSADCVNAKGEKGKVCLDLAEPSMHLPEASSVASPPETEEDLMNMTEERLSQLLNKLASGKMPDPTAKGVKSVLSFLHTSSLDHRTSPVHPVNAFFLDWFSPASPLGKTPEGASVCSREGCGRPETRPLEFWRCSCCWSERYCSRLCQLQDWRKRHSLVCRRNASAAAEVAANAAAALSART